MEYNEELVFWMIDFSNGDVSKLIDRINDQSIPLTDLERTIIGSMLEYACKKMKEDRQKRGRPRKKDTFSKVLISYFTVKFLVEWDGWSVDSARHRASELLSISKSTIENHINIINNARNNCEMQAKGEVKTDLYELEIMVRYNTFFERMLLFLEREEYRHTLGWLPVLLDNATPDK